jgi:CRISPR-associated protein Csy2
MNGYKGISPLYEAGEVKSARDSNVPFRFVEAVYGIGEWVSPHRLSDINDLMWRYHIEDDFYLCKQTVNH